MMPDMPTPIEVNPVRLYSDEYYPGFDHSPSRRSRHRIGIFSGVFALACMLSLTYTFMRPAVYRSAATLLITLPDRAEQTDNAGFVQNVAIQRQVLTKHPLLAKVLDHLSKTDAPPEALPVTVSGLRSMLTVNPLGSINMLELSAEGPQQAFLPLVVNTWLDVYLESWAQSQRTSANSTNAELRQQLKELAQQVAEKRLELDLFRQKYDIVSMERDENQVLARLKGLNSALTKVSEEVVTAEANLNAIKDTIARGKPAGDASDQATITNLEKRATELKEELREFEQRFTPIYRARDRRVQATAKKLELVEEKIQEKRQTIQNATLAEAEQTLVSARQGMKNLQQQLAAYKQTATDFTARFAEHQGLQEELSQLEQRYLEVKDRMVQWEVIDQRPRVEVLEQAFLPKHPVRPHYLRDAGISLAGSLLLGLLAVWLYEFLTGINKQPAPTAAQPLLYPVPNPRSFPQTSRNELPAAQPVAALERRLPRELSKSEVRTLVDVADNTTRLLVSVLLSGLSIEEAAALSWRHLDIEHDEIQVLGEYARTVPLAPTPKAILVHHAPSPPVSDAPVLRDTKGNPLSIGDLTALISCAAYDAGLPHPSEVTAQALRHTYVAYLVRNEARLGELERVVGHLGPAALAPYGTLSPPGPGRSLEHIALVYPALRKWKI